MNSPKPPWLCQSDSCEYPLFQKADDWDIPYTEVTSEIFNHVLHVTKCWTMLMKPFFSSHGYTLYRSMDTNPWDTCPEPFPKAAEEPKYPYARRGYEKDKDNLFGVVSGRVWGARDALGHEVVIKVISDADNPTNEFKVLQYLNQEGIRSDPRNHTIHVLEFLTFNNLVFAIMPRWDSAFLTDFGTVGEVMHCAEQFLECFEFLHGHRIFHGDFLDQNAGMNIITNCNKFFALGLRDPSVTRYVVYDFGNSQLYPHDVSLRDFRATPRFNFALHDMFEPTGPFNPFAVDFLSVSLVLQRRVRHIENFIPAIGPYFDSLVSTDSDKRPTAHEALVEFRRILSQTTSSQLAEKITTLTWENGTVLNKMTINSIY